MANLIEYIQSQIYENSTEDISGSIMQQVLTRMASDEGVVNVHTISGQTPFADYNNAQAARDAVPAGFKKLGLIITYKLSSGWYIDEFIGSATSGWSTASNWKCLGPISVSQNASTGKTTITIGSESFDVATQPVSVSQNTSTGHTEIHIGGDDYPVASVNEVSQLNQVNKFKCGTLVLATNVDKTYLSAVVGSGTTSVTIKQMLFMRRTVQTTSSYYYPAQATFVIPQDANLVAFGVIYDTNSTNPDACRYGYYTSGGDVSEMTEGEYFEPIAVCNIYGATYELRGGVLYDAINFSSILPVGNNPEIKFRGGLSEIVTNIDESFITCVDSGEYANVTIKSMLFMRRTVQTTSSYFSPTQATLTLDRNANIVVLGVIYDTNNVSSGQCRYGYYTSGGDVSQISDNECFEPFAVVEILNGQMVIAGSGGKFYQYLRTLKLENEVTKLRKIPSNVIYANNFKNTDGLGAISLSTGASVPIEDATEVVADGLKIVEFNAVLPLINTRLRDTHTRVKLNTSTAAHIVIDTYGMEGGYEGLFQLAILDFANNVVRFYTNELVAYTFNQNEDYIVDFHRIDKHNTLTITNCKTGVSTLIGTFDGVTRGNDGLMYDIVALENNGGISPIIKSFTIESGVKFPKLVIYGDSISVGYYATIVDGINSNCYAYKVGVATGMEWQSSARGGGFFDGLLGGTSRGMSYIGRMNVELPKVRPNFVMVTIGTNGVATYSQYQSVVEKILEYGGTPIINTLPIRADNDGVHNNSEIAANNAIIMQIWKDYNICGARLDLATSLNNDGVTINTSLYDSDLIHPNDVGHNAIYERIMSDCPFLFYNN